MNDRLPWVLPEKRLESLKREGCWRQDEPVCHLQELVKEIERLKEENKALREATAMLTGGQITIANMGNEE